MSLWTRFFHDRLTNLEKVVFGEKEATAIAESGPANLPDDTMAPSSAEENPGTTMTAEGGLVPGPEAETPEVTPETTPAETPTSPIPVTEPTPEPPTAA